MASKFLKKYKLSANTNYKVEDFEFSKPINKVLKANQIYKDSMLIPNFSQHENRISSQSPKVRSPLVLEPISRPSRHSRHRNSEVSEIFRENTEESERDSVKKLNSHKIYERYHEKPSSFRQASMDGRIASEFYQHRPSRRVFF